MPRRFIPAVAVFLGLVMGCSGASDDGGETSSEALSDADRVLTAAECERVESVNDSNVEGVVHAVVKGCIKGDVSGAVMIDRLVSLLSTPHNLTGIRRATGEDVFNGFDEKHVQGSISRGTRLSFDADVALATKRHIDATGTLAFVATKEGGAVSLEITNPSKLAARLVFSFTVVKERKMKINLVMKPAKNGILIDGSVAITLERNKQDAEDVANLGPQISDWLKRELPNERGPAAR